MSDPRGRHTSRDALPPFAVPTTEFPAPGIPGYGVPRYEPSRYDPPSWGSDRPAPPFSGPDSATGGIPGRRAAHRRYDQTGPIVEPEWWGYGSSDDPQYPPRPGTEGTTGPAPDQGPEVGEYGADEYASATGTTTVSRKSTRPRPPAPAPRACGTGCAPVRTADVDEAETVAHPTSRAPRREPPRRGSDGRPAGTARTTTPPGHRHVDPHDWEDETGGLEVIGAHVEEDAPRRLVRRARREHEEALRAEALRVEEARTATPAGMPTRMTTIARARRRVRRGHPRQAVRPRTGRGRRKRSPVAILLSLLVLGGLVVGIVLGGQKLLTLINPASRDYTGQGTGEVQIRVQDGDTLSDIARTLVKADVVASTGPFVRAAEANKKSVGIQPGVYGMRLQMSGQAALDLMLDPTARLLSP